MISHCQKTDRIRIEKLIGTMETCAPDCTPCFHGQLCCYMIYFWHHRVQNFIRYNNLNHDRKEKSWTASTSRCPIGFVWDNGMYLQCMIFFRPVLVFDTLRARCRKALSFLNTLKWVHRKLETKRNNNTSVYCFSENHWWYTGARTSRDLFSRLNIWKKNSRLAFFFWSNM